MTVPQKAKDNLNTGLALVGPGKAAAPTELHVVVEALGADGKTTRLGLFKLAAEATAVKLRALWKDDGAPEGPSKVFRGVVKIGPDGVAIVPAARRNDFLTAAGVKALFKAVKQFLASEQVHHAALQVLVDATVERPGDQDQTVAARVDVGGQRAAQRPFSERLADVRERYKALRSASDLATAVASLHKTGLGAPEDVPSACDDLYQVVADAKALASGLRVLRSGLTDVEAMAWSQKLTDYAQRVADMEKEASTLAAEIETRTDPARPKARRPNLPLPPPPSAVPRPTAAVPQAPNPTGVPDWFLNPVERKAKMEEHGETAAAHAELFDVSSHDLPAAEKDQLTAHRTTLTGLTMRFMTEVHMKAKEVETKAAQRGKPGTAALLTVYTDYQALLTKMDAAVIAIRPTWVHEQADKVDKAIHAKPTSHTAKLAGALGKGRVVELSRLAEMMASRWTGVKGGLNPYKVTPANEDKLHAPMEEGEVAALYGYSTADYTTLNAALRARAAKARAAKAEGRAVEEDTSDGHQPYIDACLSGLDKLAPYKGTVVRGDKTIHSSIATELLTTGHRTEPAFLSAGYTLVPGFGQVISVIQDIKTGREITPFSLHQTEGEILFPPGSKFKFLKLERDGLPDITDFKLLKGVIDEHTTVARFTFSQVS